MKSKKYIFIGPACSGKSTLIGMLAKNNSLKYYDIIEVMLPYIKKYGFVTNKNKDVLDNVVDKFIKSFKGKDFDILEFATGEYLPKMLVALKDFDITVVYCMCSKDICNERMINRERKIPKHYLDYQFKFDSGYYNNLKEEFNFKLVVLDTSDTKKAYYIIKKVL